MRPDITVLLNPGQFRAFRMMGYDHLFDLTEVPSIYEPLEAGDLVMLVEHAEDNRGRLTGREYRAVVIEAYQVPRVCMSFARFMSIRGAEVTNG